MAERDPIKGYESFGKHELAAIISERDNRIAKALELYAKHEAEADFGCAAPFADIAEALAKPKPKCPTCDTNEHMEEWGESGEFWYHCHQCNKDCE